MSQQQAPMGRWTFCLHCISLARRITFYGTGENSNDYSEYPILSVYRFY